jgi:prepilin-type N-terminal cleavage/methylation domain-containing protein
MKNSKGFTLIELLVVIAIIANLNCWRVSRTRHRQTGNNNLYLDGHSGWLYYKENTPEKWNVPGW